LEQLVEESRWQDELTKVDVQFLYNVMNDAATSTDFRYCAVERERERELMCCFPFG
jgi:hypothetical protein